MFLWKFFKRNCLYDLGRMIEDYRKLNIVIFIVVFFIYIIVFNIVVFLVVLFLMFYIRYLVFLCYIEFFKYLFSIFLVVEL